MAALGPRVTVSVGKGKSGKAVFSYMLKETANLFGFKIETTTSRKGPKGRTVSFRGSSGSGSIKVPTGKTKTVGKIKIKLYKSVPMPGDMTVEKIKVFLKTATKNKPDHFVSQDGRTHAVS